jgi:hypothetical protein
MAKDLENNTSLDNVKERSISLLPCLQELTVAGSSKYSI